MSLWTRGGLPLKDLVRRIFLQIYEDRILGHCAELAYYFLFSLFPLLLFLTTLLGYLAEANAELRVNLFSYLSRISPSQEIVNLMVSTLGEITQGKGGAKLSIGLLVAIWAASNGGATSTARPRRKSRRAPSLSGGPGPGAGVSPASPVGFPPRSAPSSAARPGRGRSRS